MRSTRRTALYAGVLFAITFIASIPGALLYGGPGPILENSRHVLGGAETRVALGAFLELVTVFANIGTAVVLFPILKWQSEVGALGYVTARVMESVFIIIGLLGLLWPCSWGGVMRPWPSRSSRSTTGPSSSGRGWWWASGTGCSSAT
jgi:hypothetical protein